MRPYRRASSSLSFVAAERSRAHPGSHSRSQIFAPEDGESNADILASYLLAQYAIFIFSSVVLTALTLRNIFS